MIVPADRFLAPSRHAIGKTSIEREEAVANVQELRREPHVEKVWTVSELNLLTGIPEVVPFNASPLPVAGIGVIVGGSDGRVRFFDAALQREYWTRRLDAPVYSSPVAVPGATDVLVSSTAGMVCRMTLAGRSTWIASLSGAVLGTIAFSPDGATAYVPVFGHRLVALDIATGAMRWEVDTTAPAYVYALAAERAPYSSPVVFASGEVVVADHDTVWCVQPSGDVRWTRRSTGTMRSSPVVVDDVVLCGTTEGFVQRWTIDGEVLPTLDVAARIDASPAVWGSSAIVAARGRGPIAIDVHTGAVRWRSDGPGVFEYTSLVVAGARTILYTNERGAVSCVDAEDGHFLWESSQVIGRPDHPTEVHTTPMPTGTGGFYVCSYHGDCYRFRHPSAAAS